MSDKQERPMIMKRKKCPQCGEKMTMLTGELRRWICEYCNKMISRDA